MSGPESRSGAASLLKKTVRRDRELRWIVRGGSVFIKLLARTWRVRQHGRESSDEARRAGQPLVYALWHGEMLPLLWAHRHEGVAILISESRDGEIITRIAESLGFRSIRGSTTRGGARALLGIVRELQGGEAVAITPDGPKGPKHQFAPGAAVAASRAGAQMVLVRVVAARAWRLGSWDAFMIPKPFTRIDVYHTDPMDVSGDGVERAAELAARMRALGEQSAAQSGVK